MPGPYTFPTDRVTGGPAPADDANGFGAAFNESADAATPNVLVLRDAEGNAKFADPVDAADAATRGWVLAQNGLLVPQSVVNFKGDLVVGTAPDVVGRLSLGFDGQVLTANSSEPTGLEWNDAPSGAGESFQNLPAVGDTFTSNWWISNSTGTLRNREDTPMPIYIGEEITIDRISFNVTVAATVNLLGQLREVVWNETTKGWDTVGAAFAVDIPLGSIGTKHIDITPRVLTVGLHAINLYQSGTFDSALRVSDGKLNGPWTGSSWNAGYSTQALPFGANTATVTGIPIIHLRRSA